MIKKHQRFFNLLLLAFDAVTLSTAYILCYEYTIATDPLFMPDRAYLGLFFWMLPLLLAVYFFMHAYSPMRSRQYRKEALILIRAHFAGMVLIYSIFFSAKMFRYSPELLFAFGCIGLLFMLLGRYLVRRCTRYVREQGYNLKHLLVIGAGVQGIDFANKVSIHRDYGYNIIGFLDDDQDKQNALCMGKQVLGGCDKLPELLEDTRFDEVVIALPLSANQKISGIINQCEKAGVRVRIIPDFKKFLPGNLNFEDFDGIPLLNTRHIPLDDPLNKFLKRALDFIVALSAIVLTSPFMTAIALGIKLTSPGPVFFRQERIGLNNKHFNMLKFRSMRVHSDKTAATTWTTPDDPRKTKFGTFLRKTSLDELPQFFNVLAGTMSIVGPRPERPFFVEQFKENIPKYMVKHQVKPGITGWAQVNGWRGDTSIEKRVECDIYYIENWDFFFDIKIMCMTVIKGFAHDNAY